MISPVGATEHRRGVNPRGGAKVPVEGAKVPVEGVSPRDNHSK